MPSPSDEQTIYNYLTGTLGFSEAGAAAALGNFDVESQFSPTSYNAREGAIGIAQWENGRRTSLDSYASSHGLSETDLTAQLGYLSQELHGGYAGVLKRMQTATDPATAAADWDANFEGSAGTTRAQRVSDAQSIYGLVSAHQPLIGAGAVGTYLNGGSGLLSGAEDTVTGAVGGAVGAVSGIGDFLSDPFGSVAGPIVKAAIKLAFVLAGLGLVLLGAWAAIRPTVDNTVSSIPVVPE